MPRSTERKPIVINTMRALSFDEIQKINDLIILRWKVRGPGNKAAIVQQHEIVQILAKSRGVTDHWAVANNLLDIVVQTYSDVGWNVLHDRPDDNTTGDATFYFSKKGH